MFITVAVAYLTPKVKSDSLRLFHNPVAEEYPDMADSYLARIPNPMDFRTIREERVPHYEEIAELQDDLILTFRNCCTYNGEDSDLYEYAV